jgi:O-antigen ligase
MTLQDAFRDRSLRPILTGLVPAQIRDYRPRLLFCCSALMMLTSLMLGGGTRGGFLSDAILELLAIPILLLSSVSLIDLPRARADLKWRAYALLACCLAALLLPLSQLVPLPPSVWIWLPGHDRIATVYDLLGQGRPWMPISMSPTATWLSFLSMLPPIAVLLAAAQLSFQERRGLSLLLIGFGVGSVVLGLAQLAQGPTSPLRFFDVTNAADAVGFFANRNHFAALLYTVLLLAAAWSIDAAYKSGPWGELSLRGLSDFDPLARAPSVAAILVLVCLLIGEATVRSRAGLLLTIVAMAGIFALAYTDRRRTSAAENKIGKIVLAAILIGVILVVQFTLYRMMSRYALDALQDVRPTFARNTFTAAMAFLPFGSGLGTFVQIYGMFEKPADALVNTFANHAHNDFLEFFLETGLVGVVYAGAFSVWFGFRIRKFWWKSAIDAAPLDLSLARAATLAIGLLIAHSLVDYPLRTDAMMAIFAICCALLIEPLTAVAAVAQIAPMEEDWLAHRKVARAAPSVPWFPPVSQPSPQLPPATAGKPRITPAQAGERWGDDIEWPEAWKK